MLIGMANLHSCLTAATDQERAWLREYLSFEDDRARFARRHTGGDGRVRMFNLITNSFATGFIPIVKQGAANAGLTVQLVDQRVNPVACDTTADLAWLRDYQREAVDKTVRAQRGILWCPTGCLAGDTVIECHRAGKSFKIKLRDLVHRFNGGRVTWGKGKPNREKGKGMRWDARVPTCVRARTEDGFVRLLKLEGAVESGIKFTYRLRTDSGKEIRATADHRFLTDEGWKRLHELNIGAMVYVEAPYTPLRAPAQQRAWYKLTNGLRLHPYAGRRGVKPGKGGWSVPVHRLVAEAHLNGLLLDQFVARVRTGGIAGLTFLDPSVYAVHHIDGDTQNNSRDNLALLPHREHWREHGQQTGWQHVTATTALDRVVAIEACGEEETFDLSMAVPHNFLANGMVVHNSGKTEIAIGLTRALPCRWLFLVHRATLMEQTADRFEKRAAEHGLVIPAGHRHAPGIAGRIGEGQWSDFAQADNFVVATFQTLAMALKRGDTRARTLLDQVQGLIVDECFPAGTQVGGVPIEALRQGDLVPSFNPETGLRCMKPVVRLMVRRPSALLRIHLVDGRTLACTPNHRVWTANGWARAEELTSGVDVLHLAHEEAISMRTVRCRAAHRDDQHNLRSVLPSMSRGQERATPQESDGFLRTMPQRDCAIGQARTSASTAAKDLLLDAVPSRSTSRIISQNSNPRFGQAFGAYAGAQPDLDAWSARPNCKQATRSRRLETNAPWFSNQRADGIAEAYGSGAQVGDRSLCEARTWAARLSSGRCEPRKENRSGAGWSEPLWKETHEGPSARRPSSWARVDRVEILESGSDGTFGGVCPDGLVYNIEVEDTHTYFANSIGVSNCHVLPADSFWSVAMATKNAFYRVGVSGTPLARGDKRSLLAIAALGPVIYRIRPDVLIAAGVLARPKIHMVPVRHMCERPTWQGVYGEAIVRSVPRNKAVLACARRADKPCLVFVKEIRHGKLLNDLLNKAGVPSEFVWGSDSTAARNGAVKRLVRGDIEVLVCSVIFQEGVDIPALRSVVIASGGKSVIATLQRIGRGMRVAHGKDEFAVFDIADKGCGCGSTGHKGCRILERHTRARVKAYEGEGFPTTLDSNFAHVSSQAVSQP